LADVVVVVDGTVAVDGTALVETERRLTSKSISVFISKKNFPHFILFRKEKGSMFGQ